MYVHKAAESTWAWHRVLSGTLTGVVHKREGQTVCGFVPAKELDAVIRADGTPCPAVTVDGVGVR